MNPFAALRSRALQALTMARLMQRGVLKPDPTPVGGPDERVFIGPANSAGQGDQWARALERARTGTRATSMQIVSDDVFRFPADLTVHAGYAAFSKAWQRRQFAALSEYRAVLVESNRGVLGRFRGTDALEQADLLQRSGAQVGLIFHGSDIRDPETRIRSDRDSYFGADAEFTATMSGVTKRSRRLIEESGLPVFVSTVDLLTEVPHASWLPVVVSPEDWAGAPAPLSHGGVPRVVHVPSKSLIKGTDLIEPLLNELHASGVVDYRRVTGVPHAEMPELYRGADIVLDQFRAGPYGVAACEAMAAGRIVISHVPDLDRERVAELTGHRLPIIQARHDELRDVLTAVLAEPAEALARAAAGPAYVRSIHNGDRSGQVLADWLDRGER
ncbi:hypothetical protein BMH32_14170 [Leucobacter sp. OLJS4]|uniref:glycosyltransferase family 1 protein n=1 Tax=unclassified Leucobacter TaxID=2621730 RepID=UPI000C192742|nr:MULTISPECIES: glycosyltransferase family 1 protein [unclassified Leucobacter]PIJ49334.1 hypothetical protein BMH30_04605 [Leucobacter sp. OLES1]PII84185.1 hypothetical protein BMH25_05555 [Leucobacter sp. OLCALW19]PII92526.1 hypothetical protein BMH27_04930 [Leucobacter sp. OLAS13]PII95675.1 hypothetical protein BMH26_01680 [Leucobacter sp. OLTLW20]PII98861.1 hypothetical protein BMH28_12085 [Leucobacter sp. OLCS4]